MEVDASGRTSVWDPPQDAAVKVASAAAPINTFDLSKQQLRRLSLSTAGFLGAKQGDTLSNQKREVLNIIFDPKHGFLGH